MKRAVYLIFFLMYSLGALAGSSSTTVPDGCAADGPSGPLIDSEIPGPGLVPLRIIRPAVSSRTGNLVLIVNGNGYLRDDYEHIAIHLARNGLPTAILERGSQLSEEVLSSLYLVSQELGLSSPTVALIGHSFGGRESIRAAILNSQLSLGHNIKAIVAVAPTIDPNFDLDTSGSYVSALLVMQGSRDEDAPSFGTFVAPQEGFAYYDFAQPELDFGMSFVDRTMIYIHGANHHSFLNAGGSRPFPPSLDYLSNADQFCIGKAKILSFLRWQFNGSFADRQVVKGVTVPNSLSQIVSDRPDNFLNPAGTPLRMDYQRSDKNDFLIKGFEDNSLSGWLAPSGVSISLFDSNIAFGPPNFVRHRTKLLNVQWSHGPTNPVVEYILPDLPIDLESYRYIQFRMGRMGLGGHPVHQPVELEVGIFDGILWHWQPLTILPIDMQWLNHLGGFYGASGMFTGRFDLWDVQQTAGPPTKLGIRLPANNPGAILLDSLSLSN